MAQGPSYYVNSPSLGTTYYAPMGYGAIPPSGSSISTTIRAWSGPNGTGSLVSVSMTSTVYNVSQGTSTNFSGTFNTATATHTAGNSTDWYKPAGKISSGSPGSLEMFMTYNAGAAFIPSISSFSPDSGVPGSAISVVGSHFTDLASANVNDVNASFAVNSDTSLTITVPNGANTGSVKAVNQSGQAASAGIFAPGLPRIDGFSPTSGGVGTSVSIFGQYFYHATAVDFNGVAASFSITNDGTIVATVPAGASNGPIHVTSAAGTGASTANYNPGTVHVSDGAAYSYALSLSVSDGGAWAAGVLWVSDGVSTWSQIM